MRPPHLSTNDVVWIRQQAKKNPGRRGIYKALTEALNATRAPLGKQLLRRNTVFAAATGWTYRHVDEIEEPVPTDPFGRPNKLLRRDVRRIVQLLDNGEKTVEIARWFGVTQEMITQINTGRRHAWATKGQSIEKRRRHRQVRLSQQDRMCLLSCAASGWWKHDVLAEIFGLRTRQAVASRVRVAREKAKNMSTSVNIFALLAIGNMLDVLPFAI